MNKLIKLILTASSFVNVLCITATAQTNVSGGIFSNATWTLANSPYIIVGNIVVFPNVILTIEPGVVVKFDNSFQIEIRQSQIIAEGTSTDSITFTSNSPSPVSGIWDKIYLNQSTLVQFNFCNFLYATNSIWGSSAVFNLKNSSFKYNGYGIYGGATSFTTIDSCSFINNNTGLHNGFSWGLNLFNSKFIANQTGLFSDHGNNIINCVFDSNSVVGIQKESGGNDTIRNNLIKYNGTGYLATIGGGGGLNYIFKNDIENNDVGIHIVQAGAHQDTIFCNAICNNTTYNIKYELSANVNMMNNYWCTTDSSLISASIYDGYDNIIYGLVNFMPIDTLQCYLSTGISINEIKKFSITVFPNPVTDKLNVVVNNNEVSEIILNDIASRKVIQTKFTNSISLNTVQLAKGIYIYEVRCRNGLCKKGKVVKD